MLATAVQVSSPSCRRPAPTAGSNKDCAVRTHHLVRLVPLCTRPRWRLSQSTPQRQTRQLAVLEVTGSLKPFEFARRYIQCSHLTGIVLAFGHFAKCRVYLHKAHFFIFVALVWYVVCESGIRAL